MEVQLDMEMQLAAEQEELLEMAEDNVIKLIEADDDIDEDILDNIRRQEIEKYRIYGDYDNKSVHEYNSEFFKQHLYGYYKPSLSKVRSLPSNFIYNPPAETKIYTEGNTNIHNAI